MLKTPKKKVSRKGQRTRNQKTQVVKKAGKRKLLHRKQSGKRSKPLTERIIHERGLRLTKKMKTGVKSSRGVVYFSHVPHGFYENEMRQFLSQFGKVTNINIPRSSRTGKYKGYAFVEFLYPEVAKVVAETMNNYLMFQKVLKAKYLPPEEQKPYCFTFPKSRLPLLVKRRRFLRKKSNSKLDDAACEKEASNLQKAMNKKLEKLKLLGVNYEFQVTNSTANKELIEKSVKNEKPIPSPSVPTADTVKKSSNSPVVSSTEAQNPLKNKNSPSSVTASVSVPEPEVLPYASPSRVLKRSSGKKSRAKAASVSLVEQEKLRSAGVTPPNVVKESRKRRSANLIGSNKEMKKESGKSVLSAKGGSDTKKSRKSLDLLSEFSMITDTGSEKKKSKKSLDMQSGLLSSSDSGVKKKESRKSIDTRPSKTGDLMEKKSKKSIGSPIGSPANTGKIRMKGSTPVGAPTPSKPQTDVKTLESKLLIKNSSVRKSNVTEIANMKKSRKSISFPVTNVEMMEKEMRRKSVGTSVTKKEKPKRRESLCTPVTNPPMKRRKSVTFNLTPRIVEIERIKKSSK